MRRVSLLFAVMAITVVWSCVASPCPANVTYVQPFPALHYGVNSWAGNEREDFDLQNAMGWYQGKQAWFIFAGSNDINTNVKVGYYTLFPKLTSAIGHGANPVYVVLNYPQGPVFSKMPGEAGYSGLWQVTYIRWQDGMLKRPIISDTPLPLAEVDLIPTDIVIDAPIFAIGPIGLPWKLAPPGGYRMKQAVYEPRRVSPPLNSKIDLPVWYAYGQDRITHRNYIATVIITDAADEALAALLGCNYAPGLAAVDPPNTQRFWVFDWTLQPPPPPSQYPILEFLPNYGGNINDLNDNYEFSPIMDLQRLQRTGLPAYAIVRTPIDLSWLGSKVTPVGAPVRINCSVIDYWPVFGRR